MIHSSNFGVTLSGEHLGDRGTVEKVVSRLRGIPKADILQTTAKLLMSMEAVSAGGIAGAQAQLAEALYPDEASEALLSLLERGSDRDGIDVLFYPQQLMALQKLALIVGEDGPPSSFDDRRRWSDSLVAAAQVSDVIQHTSRFPERGIASRSRENELAIFVLRNAEANRLAFYRSAAGRAYRMWVNPVVPWIETVPHPNDFCQGRFGTSMRRFMAICLAPAYARVNSRNPSPEEAIFDPGSYFRRGGLDIDECVRVLDELTYPDRLPESSVSEEKTYWSFADLNARPYLRSSRTTLIPCSVTRAFERGTTGVFWLLHESLSGQQAALNALTAHFGRLFEAYCLDLATHSENNTTTVQGEIEYGRTSRRDRVKSSDVLVSSLGTQSPARIFIECHALRPTQPVFVEGSGSAFGNYIDALVKKLRQLDRSILDHRAGMFSLSDDLAGPNDAYIPVLVVDEPFQWSVHLRNVIDRKIERERLFADRQVTMPVICDVGEYEHLWHLVEEGRALADLLRGYLANTDRKVSLEISLYEDAPPLGTPSYVDEGFDALSEMLIAELQLASE